MKKPNLFIVGQTRSGTTSLKEYLNGHPDVYIYHAGKGFFGYGKSEIKSDEEYCNLFREFQNKKIIGEKCSDYLHCPISAEKIKNFSPDAKIIIILRNPVDMMYSLHNWQYNMETVETIADFEEALKIEEKRKHERTQNPYAYHPHIFYQELADYYTQVKRYIDHFGRINVKVIILEEFVKNPKKTYLEVLEFLELDSNYVPDFDQHNANRIPRNRNLQKFVKNDSFSLLKFLKKIPGTGKLYESINLPEHERIILDSSLRKKLLEKLSPNIVKLSKLLEMDFSLWEN